MLVIIQLDWIIQLLSRKLPGLDSLIKSGNDTKNLKNILCH